MPPKGKKNEPSKKTQDKAKEKIIEVYYLFTFFFSLFLHVDFRSGTT